MLDGILSGLISGLVVSLMILVFNKIWSKVVVPWFEERIYKDAKIEGSWFGLVAIADNNVFHLNLRRHGHNVHGTLVCVAGGDEGEQYKVSGSFRNMILPLIYETEHESKTDRGTLTLMLELNGEKLAGILACYATANNSVASMPALFFKDKSLFDTELNNMKIREQNRKKVIEQQKAEAANSAKTTEEIPKTKSSRAKEPSVPVLPEPVPQKKQGRSTKNESKTTTTK